jgi:tRNA U38,U39,U40 pseudouridine synthase TruA
MDIRVHDVAEVSRTFHARFKCVADRTRQVSTRRPVRTVSVDRD